MDDLSFIASITASLAWPAAVCALLFAYRDPITQRILSLRSAKYKELELFFDRELKALDATIKAPQNSLPSRASRGISALVTERPDEGSLGEAQRLLDADLPEAAIFSAWATVEADLRAFLRSHGMPNVASSHVSTLEQINALAQSTLADSQTVDVLRRMYNLFNVLSHEGGFSINETKDYAREYIALAKGIIERFHRLDGATD